MIFRLNQNPTNGLDAGAQNIDRVQLRKTAAILTENGLEKFSFYDCSESL